MEICEFSEENTLTKRQVSYAVNRFKKTARVGFEIEGNIPRCGGCEYFEEPCFCTNYMLFCDNEEYENEDSVNVSHVDCSRIERETKRIYNAIADELGCDVGHNRHYVEGRNFQCVYYDGSVNIELVTSAIALPRVKEVLLRGYKALKAYKVKLSPYERAGGHQTISYDGTYHKVTARNVLQLVRYYLPALLGISCVKGTEKRDGGFRSIPECGYRQRKRVVNEKYTALHIKGEHAVRSKPKLLEFRYPDSHLNINQTILTAVFNMAVIAKAMKLSSEGIVKFSQRHFNLVKRSTHNIYFEGSFGDYNFVEDLMMEMFEYLSEEISLFANIQSVKAGIDELVDRGFPIKNRKDIRTSPISH